MGWRVFIEAPNYQRDLTVRMANVREDGSMDIHHGPYCVTHVAAGDLAPAKTALFEGEEHNLRPMLQALVDACWEYGIKPTDWNRMSEPQSRHLEDMRAIVAKACGVEFKT